MAKRGGFWSEMQREHARRERLERQELRAAARTAATAKREREQRRREAERRAAANERERKRLYVEGRKGEAATLSSEIDLRVAALQSVLATHLDAPVPVSFASLKRRPNVTAFNPAGLDKEVPPPDWEEFAPPPPGLIAKAFGGSARYRRAEAAARGDYAQRCAEHAVAETTRKERLEERRQVHAASVREASAEADRHNAGVDEFEARFRAVDREAVMEFFTLVLDGSRYPEGFPHLSRVVYREQPRDLVVDFELPPQEVVPTERSFKYIQTRDKIEAQARPAREVKTLYAGLVAQVALRTLHEIFAVPDADETVSAVTFNGRVSTIDKATGQSIRPHLISVGATREQWSTLVLGTARPAALPEAPQRPGVPAPVRPRSRAPGRRL